MRVWLIVGSLMVLSRVAPAEYVPFATAPSSAPSLAEAPAASPKEALRSLNAAFRDGDIPAIRSLLHPRNEMDARLITAMADYAAALVALHRAAETVYGSDGANMVTGDIALESQKGLAAIEKAEVVDEGETALVKFAGATDAPIKLLRVAGRWKLPLSQTLDGVNPAAEEARLREVTHQAKLTRQTATELTAGRYKEGAAKAAEVWRSRLLASVTLPAPASSQPSGG